MVLQGMKIATFIGWLSGTLFIKSPLGIPVYSPFRSRFSVYAIIIYVLSLAVGMNMYVKHMMKVRRTGMVPKFLNLSVSLGPVIFDMYFRTCFFLRAKIVPRFLKSLEMDMKKLPPLTFNNAKQWKFYKRVIFFTTLYLYGGGVLTTLWLSKVITNPALYGFIPSPYSIVIFFFFSELPLMSSAIVSFALVVATTFHIFWIFEDFCETLEQQLNLHNLAVSDKLQSSISKKDTAIAVITSPNALSKETLLSKFEHVKLLCNQYDKLAGPLLLGLMVRSVFVLIHSANAVLLHEGSDSESRAKYLVDIFHFLTELSQLVLLEMGNHVHRKIFEKKEKLARLVILMRNIEARDQMKEIMRVITSWDWKITGGPQFFTIERSLLSGVVSSLMTYVVILFQLNVPEETKLDITNTTSTTPFPADFTLYTQINN